MKALGFDAFEGIADNLKGCELVFKIVVDRGCAVHDHYPHHGQGMAKVFGFGLVKFAEPISGLVYALDHDVQLLSDHQIAAGCGLVHAVDQLVGIAHGIHLLGFRRTAASVSRLMGISKHRGIFFILYPVTLFKYAFLSYGIMDGVIIFCYNQ